MNPSLTQPTAVERRQLEEFRRRLYERVDELDGLIDGMGAFDERGMCGDVDVLDEVYRHERELDGVLATLERLDAMFPTCRALVA